MESFQQTLERMESDQQVRDAEERLDALVVEDRQVAAQYIFWLLEEKGVLGTPRSR